MREEARATAGGVFTRRVRIVAGCGAGVYFSPAWHFQPGVFVLGSPERGDLTLERVRRSASVFDSAKVTSCRRVFINLFVCVCDLNMFHSSLSPSVLSGHHVKQKGLYGGRLIYSLRWSWRV